MAVHDAARYGMLRDGRHGDPRQCLVRRCMVRQAGQCMSRRGHAGYVRAGRSKVWQVWRGMSRKGLARRG